MILFWQVVRMYGVLLGPPSLGRRIVHLGSSSLSCGIRIPLPSHMLLYESLSLSKSSVGHANVADFLS